jgi:type II secretory pathway component PulC
MKAGLKNNLSSRTARSARPSRWHIGVRVALLGLTAIYLVSSNTDRLPAERTPAPLALRTIPTPTIEDGGSESALRFRDQNISLNGVTLSGDQSIALLSVDDRTQKAFAIGQEIAAGISVHAIHPEHVVLNYRNLFKTLRMQPAQKPETGPMDAVAYSSAHSPIAFLLNPESVGAEESGGIQEFWRDIRVAPQDDNGFLVQEVTAESIYAKLGVRPGDLVYTLDSLTLIKLEELSKLGAISNAAGVSLEVVRDGQPVWLTYRFDNPAS